MLCAQDSGAIPPATVPVAPPENEPAAPKPESSKADVLLRTESGDLIPLRDLLGANLIDELLLRGLEQRSVPRYTLAQLELSGAVDRDEVTLKIDLQIQVHPADEWVTIPIAFGDVFVTHFDHKSDVPNTQAVLTSGEQNCATVASVWIRLAPCHAGNDW